MFRALFIKGWYQLRALRWAVFGIGLVLPVFLWAGASAARRGWLPFRVGDFSAATLFGEALPMFTVGLWCLVAVLFAAQSFAGDRGEGSEGFLLERPVPRGAVWRSRLAAAAASLLAVAVGHGAYVGLLAALTRDPAIVSFWPRLAALLALGLAVSLLGLIGGAAAGEMVSTPMQAFLFGVVLACVAPALAAFLGGLAPYARLADRPVGIFAPIPFVLGLLVAGYRSGCLGEPAGRGRLARGGATLAVALVVTFALFAGAAPFAVRSSVGEIYFVGGQARHAARSLLGASGYPGGGWALDAGGPGRLSFLAPPLFAGDWNDDGSRLALAHAAGPLGTVGSLTLEVRDREGATVASARLEMDLGQTYPTDVFWVDGKRLALREWIRVDEGKLRVFDDELNALGTIPLEGPQQTFRFFRTTGGEWYAFHMVDRDELRWRLQRVDFESMRLDPHVLLERDGLPTWSRYVLSPSGRFLLTSSRLAQDEAWFVEIDDLDSGERIRLPESYAGNWLEADLLVLLTRTGGGVELTLGPVGGEPILRRESGGRLSFRVSPDRRRLLALEPAVDDFEKLPTHSPWETEFYRRGYVSAEVWDASEKVDLGALVDGLDALIAWTGPTRLVAVRGKNVAIAEARPDSAWTAVAGRWPPSD